MSFRKNLYSHEIGEKFGGDEFSVVLQPRSLLFFSDHIYTKYKHGIEAGTELQCIGDYGRCLNTHLINMTEKEKVRVDYRNYLSLSILIFMLSLNKMLMNPDIIITLVKNPFPKVNSMINLD